MASIMLASNFIDGAWWASGTAADFGHLQIVFEELELEVQAPNPITIPFGGDWLFAPIRPHSSTENTPNFGNPEYYAATEVGLGQERSSDQVWELLIQVRDSLAAATPIDYNYDQNSNSFVNTLLYVAGIDLGHYLGKVTLPSMDNGFPGADRNVLFDLAGGSTPISIQLDGTNGNDVIQSGLGNDQLFGSDGNDTIRGNAGDDILSGGDGEDFLFGGAGDDLLAENFEHASDEPGGAIFGGSGHDTIRASLSDGSYEIYGGSGADSLIGNGARVRTH